MAARPEAAVQQEEDPGKRRARILVLDDDPHVRRALQLALKPHCDVVVATDGATALARLRSGERFDLILSDVEMPIMNGIDFYKALRSGFPAESDRVVFMSGGLGSPDAAAFFCDAALELLDKPISCEELKALLARRLP